MDLPFIDRLLWVLGFVAVYIFVLRPLMKLADGHDERRRQELDDLREIKETVLEILDEIRDKK